MISEDVLFNAALFVCTHRQVKEHLIRRHVVSAPKVLCYTAVYWSGVHTAFLVVCGNVDIF